MARLIAGMGHHMCRVSVRRWIMLARRLLGGAVQGFAPLRAWHAEHVPDVTIIVFNDHATSMSWITIRPS